VIPSVYRDVRVWTPSHLQLNKGNDCLGKNYESWGNPNHENFPNMLCVSSFATAVSLNRRAAVRYRALASIIPGCERPEETTICYMIPLVQLITNLNVILYLSTWHAVNISVLILFMMMP